MPMTINRRDLDFYLYEMFGLGALFNTERYGEYDREAIAAMFDTAESVAENEFLPCAAKMDVNEPEFIDGKVRTIPETKQGLKALKDTGFFAASFDFEDGGLQLPQLVVQALHSIFMAHNVSLYGYAILTMSNANMFNKCGSQELKDKYLPKLISGDWFGTMCLSEPQAGSSLTDIRTKAERREDGSYKISGTKMWISGGDQDITENIVHMVLAKIPDGPPGVKGISLFLVPKFRVDDDGSLGEFNNVVLAGLNHKMGQRGITNTLLNFGESGDCIGYLVGEEHKGLSNMFHMMNEARIFVGMGACTAGVAGLLYSLDYARNRPQGRRPGEKNPESPQLMISEHADVKRMLMTQKAYSEGGMALALYASSLIDVQQTTDSKDEQYRCAMLLELLTPIVKSWPSEYCLEANKLAIQVLGGYGYTREYPVERHYRDNRLNPIHEGTHAIHGIDLLGRKVRMNNGIALKLFGELIEESVQAARKTPDLETYGDALFEAFNQAVETVNIVAECEKTDLALANATIFLDAFGHVVIAWIWLKQAQAAQLTLTGSGDINRDFYQGKLSACQFFFRYELPKVAQKFNLVAQLDDTCLALTDAIFCGE